MSFLAVAAAVLAACTIVVEGQYIFSGEKITTTRRWPFPNEAKVEPLRVFASKIRIDQHGHLLAHGEANRDDDLTIRGFAESPEVLVLKCNVRSNAPLQQFAVSDLVNVSSRCRITCPMKRVNCDAKEKKQNTDVYHLEVRCRSGPRYKLHLNVHNAGEHFMRRSPFTMPRPLGDEHKELFRKFYSNVLLPIFHQHHFGVTFSTTDDGNMIYHAVPAGRALMMHSKGIPKDFNPTFTGGAPYEGGEVALIHGLPATAFQAMADLERLYPKGYKCNVERRMDKLCWPFPRLVHWQPAPTSGGTPRKTIFLRSGRALRRRGPVRRPPHRNLFEAGKITHYPTAATVEWIPNLISVVEYFEILKDKADAARYQFNAIRAIADALKGLAVRVHIGDLSPDKVFLKLPEHLTKEEFLDDPPGFNQLTAVDVKIVGVSDLSGEAKVRAEKRRVMGFGVSNVFSSLLKMTGEPGAPAMRDLKKDYEESPSEVAKFCDSMIAAAGTV